MSVTSGATIILRDISGTSGKRTDRSACVFVYGCASEKVQTPIQSCGYVKLFSSTRH